MTTLIALYACSEYLTEEYEEVCVMTGFRTRYRIHRSIETGAETLQLLGPS